MYKFRRVFSIPNRRSSQQHAYYSWENRNFEEFMLHIFSSLEPYYAPRSKIILAELDDVNEVVFITVGSIKIGFEINKQEYYRVQIPEGFYFGAFQCFFNKRMTFIHKAGDRPIQGFFVRKQKWKGLCEEFPDLMLELKKKAVKKFGNTTQFMEAEKEKVIEHFYRRADFR